MAEPSNLSRLRLGQELREVREQLMRSKSRHCFQLESREATRPRDITQAIFDFEPQIIHFAGHGNSSGELCFESMSGVAKPVSTDALTSLFKLVSKQVQCVVINTCHSQAQAKAISEQISYVIGMRKEIGDEAAIAFSTGFYRALGAHEMIDRAFKFGCAEIQMEGIPEHSTPILYKKKIEDKTIWVLTIEATLDEVGDGEIENILKSLSQFSGDTSIKLKKKEAGSVKLTLEGSHDGFERINQLIQSGQIKEIEGLRIQSIRKETDIPAKKLPQFIRYRTVEVISEDDTPILCCYVNTTSEIQIARIKNVADWYFERAVFPGQRLLFEAYATALLEIHTGTTSSAILSDTIPCRRLSIDLESTESTSSQPDTSTEQILSRPGIGWERRTE